MQYIVLQVVLKESFIGTGSKNLTELEQVINNQAAKGYRLHTISTASSGSKGAFGGDRIQATLVFEKIEQKTMQRHCIYCGQTIDGNSNFCVHCGKQQ